MFTHFKIRNKKQLIYQQKITQLQYEMLSQCLLLVSVSVSVQSTTFELFQLPESSNPHPQPYCNDGSQAGYYHDTDYTKLGKVHVHLQGGNLCDSDGACEVRCDRDGDGQVDNSLCTASTQQVTSVCGKE